MVAVNKIHRYRNNIGLRIWGLFIWLLGLIIYSWLVFAFYLDFARMEFKSSLDLSIYFLKYLVFAPGFIPLVIGAFFLMLFQKSQDFFMGAFVILPIFIVLHYVVAVFEAHASDSVYFGFQLFEILCAVVVIVKYQRKWQRLAVQ